MGRQSLKYLVGLGWLVQLLGCPAAEQPSRDRGSAGQGGPSFAGAGGTVGMMDGALSGSGAGGTGSTDGAAGGAGSGDAGGAGAGGTYIPPEERVFDADRTNENRNKITAGQLCDRLSTIQCAGEAFCCDDPGRDRATCKEQMLMGCRVELLLDEVATAPEAGFDAATAEAAFTEFERLASMCDPFVARWGIAVDGLRGIMQGTIAASEECTPAGFSLSSLPSNADAAVALASCSGAATHACMPGLSRWTCKARAAEGESCFTDANCLDGLYCDNPDLNLSGNACKLRKPGGAACELPNECESLSCRGGSCAAPGDVQAAYCLR